MKFESVARQQMACLGDASRYRIVSELTSGPVCVTELAGRIGLSQSCTTRHLQALVRAGLVSRERAGRRVLFTVRSQDPAVRSLLDWKSQLENGSAPPRPERRGRGRERAARGAPASGEGPRPAYRAPGDAGDGPLPADSPGRGAPAAVTDRDLAGPGKTGDGMPGSGAPAAQSPGIGPEEPPAQRRRIHEELEDFLL